MTGQQQWPMYVWAVAVAIAIAAGVWAALNRREVRPALPLEHVAGAALVGLFGWEALVNLPGLAIGYWNLTAGISDARVFAGHQAYVVGEAAFVIGAAFAVSGILRRRTWGAVLGIGLAFAVVVSRGLLLYETTTLYGASMSSDAYLSMVATVIGMQAIPALAAIALLTWPLVRRTRPRSTTSGHDVPAASVPSGPGL